MSISSSSTTTNAGAAAGDGTTVLDPNAIVEQLRSLRQHIPGYGQLSVAEATAILRTAHVDADFVQSSINAVGASEVVQSALGRTPDDLRSEIADAGSWTSVEDELRSILKGVSAANLVRRHRVGLAALQTYSITRQLVRDKQHADLLPHVAEMRRLNRFGRRLRATKPKKQSPQHPAPQSPEAPAPHLPSSP
jgi:hypothetical protein